MTYPHTMQERGPFACPRCGAEIRFVTREGLVHERRRVGGHCVECGKPAGELVCSKECADAVDLSWPEDLAVCTWLDEASDEQVEGLR